jgi:hypothetical protein
VRANSSAGRVLPAPGAAEIRKGPLSQVAIAASARVCQARSTERLAGGRRLRLVGLLGLVGERSELTGRPS